MNNKVKYLKYSVILVITFFVLNIIFGNSIFAGTNTKNEVVNNTVVTTRTTTYDDGSVKTIQESGDKKVGTDIEKIAADSWKDVQGLYEAAVSGHSFTGILGYSDLAAHGDLLCSDQGTYLHDEGVDPSQAVDTKGSSYYSSDVPDLTSKVTKVVYKAGETNSSTPLETFILTQATHDNGGLGEYTPAQNAWWNTEAGGNHGGSYNSLYRRAQAFEKYILRAAGVNSVDKLEKDADGFYKINYEPKWRVDGSSSDLSTNYADPKVLFNESNMIVGPFAIDYIYDKNFAMITNMTLETNDSEHPTLEYGKDWLICGETEAPLFDDSTNLMKFNAPMPNKTFYLLIKNKYNATKLTNIHVDFAYTNGKGSYRHLLGEYKKSTTTKELTSEPIYYKDENGKDQVRYVTKYSWSIKWGSQEAQTLTDSIEAEIRKFETSLDRKDLTLSSQVQIIKEVVDENGEKLEVGENDYFDFELDITGATNMSNTTTENLRVKANSSAVSSTYFWTDPNVAPIFTVKEVGVPEGYKVVAIEPEGAFFENGKTIKVHAINEKVGKTGALAIVKKAENYVWADKMHVDNEVDLINGKEFEFGITITGLFKYKQDAQGNYDPNGKFGKYQNQTLEIPSVMVVADGKAHVVIPEDSIKWYGDEAPSYTVEEKNLPEGVELVSITANAGVFREGGVSTVTAVNKQKTEKGRIRIIKTLEDGEKFYSEEDARKLEFHFKIRVGGGVIRKITTNHFEIDSSGKYIWSYTSGEYEWSVGNNPKYEILEVDNPAGTLIDTDKTKEANKNDSTIEVVANKITGTMKSNGNATGVVDNYVINKITDYHTGNIKLIKETKEETFVGPEIYDFSIVVTSKAKFAYDSNGNGTFEDSEWFEPNTIIQLTNADQAVSAEDNEIIANGYSKLKDIEERNNKYFVKVVVQKIPVDNGIYGRGTYDSNSFKWCGDVAPTYKIEEDLKNADINHTIEPSEGSIADETSPIPTIVKAINCHNQESKVGTLHIIKKLENSDKLDAEEIKKLKFNFIVNVENYGEHTVELTAKLVGNEWIWEKEEGPYAWDADKAALHYSIEEDTSKLNTGIVFKEIDSSSDGTINGKKIEGQLKENVASSVEFDVTEATFINKVEEKVHEGKIVVNKVVTVDSLKGKEFVFNITMTGNFEYNGQTYTTSNPYKGTFTVKGGESHTISGITWSGNAPTYVIEEQESDIANNISRVNESGTLECIKSECSNGEDKTAYVSFTNGPTSTGGYLEVTKKIADGKSSDATFYFEITIGNNAPYTISLKANETYKSNYISWNKTDDVPNYKVEEINIPDGVQFDSMETSNGSVNGKVATGKLIAGSSVSVVATNKADEKHGRFDVVKEVAKNKLVDSLSTYEFDMEITISGTFEMNGKTYNNGNCTYNITIPVSGETGKGVYNSPEITWYGNNAPTVSVKEINLPKGWKQVGSVANDGAALKENGEVITLTVTNELPVYPAIEFFVEFAGDVWEEYISKEKNYDSSLGAINSADGIMSADEEKIKGVEVYIYRVVVDANGNAVGTPRLASVYADDLRAELNFPLLTSTDGKWDASGVNIETLTDEEKAAGGASVKYDVEFVYDGQTYEPTLFLSRELDGKYQEGSASDYLKASTSDRDKFANRSMAKDANREEVDNRIQSVYGGTAMNGNLETTGKVNGNSGENSINYVGKEDANRVVSTLKTTDSQGRALDLYKASAKTSIGGIAYPFESEFALDDADQRLPASVRTELTDLGLKQTYTYKAIYNYCLHINLGLVKRDEVDVEIEKDLYSALVTVKDKYVNYTFNKLSDIGKSKLNRTLTPLDLEAVDNVSYQLGLYKTDYYYRAEIYKENTEAYDAVQNFYKALGKTLVDSELEVYLTYRIGLYNLSKSGQYTVGINSVNDYFDSALGNPIQAAVDANKSKVATKSYMVKSSRAQDGKVVEEKICDVDWNVVSDNAQSSNGITYKKMTANFDDVRLKSGESRYIYVTFAVRKADMNGVIDAIKLGDKSNVAEIASYSTYYAETGRSAGKVDRDSAADNINIRDYNSKEYYEDDTEMAPVLELKLLDESREINGIAWEDKAGNGEGYLDADDARIGGLTTELVEKITILEPNPNGGAPNGNYVDYDFLWPSDKAYDFLGGRTLNQVTGGLSTTIETSRTTKDVDGLDVGEYKFTNIPAGTFVVRFVYGNDKTELENMTTSTLAAPQALKVVNGAVTSYSGNDNVLPANYDKDLEGKTASVYNGQDYKSTVSKATSPDQRVSDANDSEARRLEVIANSQTITNVNSNVLSSANAVDVDHTELYRNYYMYADSKKIDMDYENIKNGNGDQKLVSGFNAEAVMKTLVNNGVLAVVSEETTYSYDNLDFGLIERPENNLILDEEVGEIKLITNDEKVIFDAYYDVSYEEKSLRDSELEDYVVVAKLTNNDSSRNDYLVANVVLNEEKSVATDLMQAINKTEIKLSNTVENGRQNFRFINVDEDILQGAKVEINYIVSAINASEEDYTSEKLYNITTSGKDRLEVKNDIIELAKLAEQVESGKQVKLADGSVVTPYETGAFVGTNYFVGNKDASGDKVVTTRVRQVVDYVDNDAEFLQSDNTDSNHLWRNTTITELTGNGYDADRLVDKTVIPGFDITDDDGASYLSRQRNNLIISVDNINGVDGSNSEFEKELVPYALDKEGYKSDIALTITKVVSATDSADSMAYDNLAEIVKFENTVGRRDSISTPGNTNPKKGEFVAGLVEPDESATELVTFTPPTGIETENVMTSQILIIVAISLGIVACGIIIIKKIVLNK